MHTKQTLGLSCEKYFVRTPTNHVSSRWVYMQLHASHAVTASSHMSLFCIADCEPIGCLLLSLAQGRFSYLGNVALTIIFIVRFQVPRSLVVVRMLISIDWLLPSLAQGHLAISRQRSSQNDLHCQMHVPRSLVAFRMFEIVFSGIDVSCAQAQTIGILDAG